MTSPNKLTFELFTREGWRCATVEQWIPHATKRRDLFGIGDIVAIRADVPGVTMLQATTVDRVVERVRKALASSDLEVWLGARNAFFVVGWQEIGNPLADRVRYTHVAREITLADFLHAKRTGLDKIYPPRTG